MEVYQRIKLIRQELKLSQAKFAKALSISNGYIAGIEINRNKVNDRIIRLICYTFNVNDRWIRTGEGEMFNENGNPSTELAVSTFESLMPEFQKYILKQIDDLLEIQNKENEQ